MQNVHPMFIHFPIALLSTGLLLDILGVLFNRESLRSGGFLLLVFGATGITAAAITGFLAEGSVPHKGVTDGPEANPAQKMEKMICEHEDGSLHKH